MRSARYLVGLAFTVLSLALAAPALALDGTGAQTACERDIRRLCSDAVVPDERRILACLLPDRTRLSPACGPSAQTGTITVAANKPEPAPHR